MRLVKPKFQSTLSQKPSRYGGRGKIREDYTDLVEDDLGDGISSEIRKLWVSAYVGAAGKKVVVGSLVMVPAVVVK